jgi:hypothetical protein
VAALAGPAAAGEPDTEAARLCASDVFATVSSVATGTAGDPCDATVTGSHRAIRLAPDTKVSFIVPAKSVIMKKAGKVTLTTP